MEFPFNVNSPQAPDDVFSLLNSLHSSGTANTDEIENADFSGLPPESSVPCFPTRHANEQQPSSLVNGEIIGGESLIWNPYSALPPLSICPSNDRSSEIAVGDSQNHLAVCQNQRTNHLPDAVAPPNSTAPTIKDENQAFAMWLDSEGSFLPSSYQSGLDNIFQYWPFDGSSMPNTKLIGEYSWEHRTRIVENPMSIENANFRYGEVNGHEDNNNTNRKVKPKYGCKGCKCKNTKCLQLYCKCFASGYYCDETCACKDCNNRIQCRSTVFRSRKSIKRRNSYAFSPTIVFEYLPVQSTIYPFPSGARHRRGCSCKKSMCIKKYCECYQAGVKCSVLCRCKDCGNIYKQKDDFIIREPMNNHVYSYGEMLPQAPYHNYSNFRPQSVVSLEELFEPSCLSLQSDRSISMSFGNSMDDSAVFRGRRAEDGNLAPFPPQLNPYSVAMGSSISSSFPLRQWPPTECSDLTFGSPPLPLMNCYGASADHNGTPLILNEGGSGTSESTRSRVNSVSTPSRPPLISSTDAKGISEGTEKELKDFADFETIVEKSSVVEIRRT